MNEDDAATSPALPDPLPNPLIEPLWQALVGHRQLQDHAANELAHELSQLLESLLATEPQILSVQTAAGLRPQRLGLFTLATDQQLDAMYQQEWAELALGSDGWLYFVMRYRSADDYAVRWSSALVRPESLWPVVPNWLAQAL